MVHKEVLDRKAETPLHRQLYEHLRTQITSGERPTGARLPTEAEIGKTYAVSRGTVRQALRELERARLIERTPRRGTFVTGLVQNEARDALGPHRLISVVLPFGDGHEAFFMDIMRGVQVACRSRGTEVTFGYSHESLETEQRELARLKRAGSLGVVIFPHAPDETVPFLRAQGQPFVVLDRFQRGTEVDFVGIDNVAGAYRATEHLILLGHTEIAFIHYNATGLESDLTSVQDRWQGYRKALRDYEIAFQTHWFYGGRGDGNEDEANAYTAFFSQQQRPSAAFVVNDRTAIFFLRAAKLMQVTVPQTVAVVGFDDLPIVSHLGVALTTVHQPRFDLGFRAAHLLLDRLEGITRKPAQLLLPTELKIRESCGARLDTQSLSPVTRES